MEYELGKCHVPSYGGTTFSAKSYYDGLLVFIDEYKNKQKKPVCFIPLQTFEQAIFIYDLSRKFNNCRVLSTFLLIRDQVIKRFLLCFDHFEDLERMKFPKPTTTTVSGNPSFFIQREIKALAEGVRDMHLRNVSSSLLNHPCGYVWCPNTSEVKILLVNVSCQVTDNDAIINLHIDNFRDGLRMFFLNRNDWPERDRFLNCLDNSNVHVVKRLKMLINHPFLQNSYTKILLFFSMLWLALISESTYEGFDLFVLKEAFRLNAFRNNYYDGNRSWRKIDWSNEFETAFNDSSEYSDYDCVYSRHPSEI